MLEQVEKTICSDKAGDEQASLSKDQATDERDQGVPVPACYLHDLMPATEASGLALIYKVMTVRRAISKEATSEGCAQNWGMAKCVVERTDDLHAREDVGFYK